MTTIFRVKKQRNYIIVFKSRSMRKVLEIVRKVAPASAPVLILGESGVGKELVVRAIHRMSPRKDSPFVAVNCSAFAENLLESELFGHEKGAFTGAVQDKKGRFELADDGTIFLDEIGELSPSFQVKLLRVLQEHEFERVGGTKTIKVNARIVAATNKDLDAGVKDGWFREDLFFRLNVVPIVVPPLRERRADIPPLIDHFIAKYAKENARVIRGMTQPCRQMLLRYDYPGNIRELENIIQRAVILTDSPLLDVRDLPTDPAGGLKTGLNAAPGPDVWVETETLLEALKKIAVFNKKGEEKIWHEGLRCITIDDIHRFLVIQGNKWFSRNRFEELLRTCSGSDVDKYKTAGVYLRILKSNDILTHNGRQANLSAYCLANRFVTSNKHS